MKKKRKRQKPKSPMGTAIKLTTGTIGLSVASSAAATLPGPAGTIVRGGALPIAGLGLLKTAAKDLEKY